MAMLEHGGRLRAAALAYGRPIDQWIDLSTGISPWPYPIPSLPLSIWQRLPEPDDDLNAAAAAYYGSDTLLATAGSQPAIQHLPTLFTQGTVAIIGPTYNEHIAAWRNAGHSVHIVHSLAEAVAYQATVTLLCNPNNPTTSRYTAPELISAAQQLQNHQGWLIVDEAYGDIYPEACVTPQAGSPSTPRLITLRSIGKFFGLAGARVGFVFGAPSILSRLAEKLGPWTVSGPARVVAQKALADHPWQIHHIAQIKDAGVRLHQLLARTIAPMNAVQSIGLFSTFVHPEAAWLFDHLARQGILVRLFRETARIRIGIAADHQWKRLENALLDCTITTL